VTSTPINGNVNKTYTVQKKINLKQKLIDSIREYQRTAVSQLKNKLLEKIANAYMRPNNEQTDLTSRDITSKEPDTSQYIDGRAKENNESIQHNNKEERKMDGNDKTSHKDVLKREEDRLLEKSIIAANKKAIQRLRLQRIALLKECVLSSSDDDEEKKLDAEELDREWHEEADRTNLILSSIYDNFRMINATNTYKDVTVIKNEKSEPHYRITTIVMTEKLDKNADDTKLIRGTLELKGKDWKIDYKYGEEGKSITESIERKSSEKESVLQDITMKNPFNEKENISMEQLVQEVKANKPKIKEIKVIQKARELRSTKRQRSPQSKEKEKETNKRKPSHHNVKSRQDGLAGEVKPTKSRTPTPQEARTPEPTPGTSGINKDKEISKPTSKTMILSPEGKLIPFRKIERDTAEKKGEKSSDPPKYKYTL